MIRAVAPHAAAYVLPAFVLGAGHRELSGKTMLVVGLGGSGSEVARRANALGMRVPAT